MAKAILGLIAILAVSVTARDDFCGHHSKKKKCTNEPGCDWQKTAGEKKCITVVCSELSKKWCKKQARNGVCIFTRKKQEKVNKHGVVVREAVEQSCDPDPEWFMEQETTAAPEFLATCLDGADFADKNGFTCDDYADKRWCDGLDITKPSKTCRDETAANCASADETGCCICGGGHFATGRTALAISVASVNGHSNRSIPEPYKRSILCADTGCSANDKETYCWELTLQQPDWYHESSLTPFQHFECREGAVFAFNFTTPGRYSVRVQRVSDRAEVTAVVKNLYARREIRDLDAGELGLYVDAVWKLHTTSTDEGRQRFTCPSGKQSDFHTRYFFILTHMVLSYNQTCDQLHFTNWFPLTHFAFLLLEERALQCIHPSVAIPYWDMSLDASLENKLDSRVFDIIGGRGNYDESAANPAYYVTDGVFANMPLRRNRTGLCEELWDDELISFCNLAMNSPLLGPSATTGFEASEPRPPDSYAFVSRRPTYFFGRDASFLWPTSEDVQHVLDQERFADAAYALHEGLVHLSAHYLVGGLWAPAGGEPITNTSAITDDGIPRGSGMMTDFMWSFEAGIRKDGCYTCDSTQCFPRPGATERGCFDGSITTPNTVADLGPTGSTWNNWLGRYRTKRPELLQTYGINRPNTGTYGRHPMANMDPAFNLCHMWTCAVLDRFLQSRADGPYYGTDQETQQQCAGHNFLDATPYRGVVPYKKGQDVGARHSWADLLDGWSTESRTFRFVHAGAASG